jgi:CheY-like chemotaxis protein
MKILVFDDSSAHQISAKLTIKGHDLTVVGSYDQAQAALTSQIDYDEKNRILAGLLVEAGLASDFKSWTKGASDEDKEAYRVAENKAYEMATTHPDFNVVLTDLLVPASNQAMGGEGARLVGQEMPLGTTIALLSLTAGVKNVAVVTDMNHHHHPASAAFDCFKTDNRAPDINLLCTNRVDMVYIDAETRELVDETFLVSEEGQKKYPLPEGKRYGDRMGILYGKDWGQILQQLLKEDAE